MPYDTKVDGETTRSTVVMHTVLPQIANYPCLIAIHGDNSNIGPFLLSLWRVLFQYYLACMSLWILEKLIAFLFANRAATIGIGIVGSKWKYSVCVCYTIHLPTFTDITPVWISRAAVRSPLLSTQGDNTTATAGDQRQTQHV